MARECEYTEGLVGSHLVVIEPALAVVTKPVVEVVHDTTIAATTHRAARKEDIAKKRTTDRFFPDGEKERKFKRPVMRP